MPTRLTERLVWETLAATLLPDPTVKGFDRDGGGVVYVRHVMFCLMFMLPCPDLGPPAFPH